MNGASVPLVSLVTPVLNGARFLSENLASIRAQDHPRIEHIVVDGGSSDGTLELLRGAPGIRWMTGRDGGMYDAIRQGLHMAQGEIVGYQNADDRYAAPDVVSTVVRYLHERPEVDVVYGDFRFIDEQGRALEAPRGRDFDARALRRYNFVPPHATFLRARVVREGFAPDPSLQFAGDWEWFLRLSEAGKRFARLPRVLAEYRRHGGSKSATTGWELKTAEWRRICRAHRASFALMLWHEAVWVPFRRHLESRRAPR
jgi:glycosyltransferase involved in cell wall biosynthesis